MELRSKVLHWAEVLRPDPAKVLYLKYPSLRRVETLVYHRTIERRGALRLIKKGGVGAEIGVFTGLFSRVLFRATEPKHLYLVDGWNKLFGEHFGWSNAYTDGGRLTTFAALEATRRRAAPFGDRCTIVVDTALDWLAGLPNGHLNWVYLDASHRFDTTLNELRAIAPKLNKYGLIACDDANPDRRAKHHDVYRAIRDFTKEQDFEIVYIGHRVQAVLRRTIDGCAAARWMHGNPHAIVDSR